MLGSATISLHPRFGTGALPQVVDDVQEVEVFCENEHDCIRFLSHFDGTDDPDNSLHKMLFDEVEIIRIEPEDRHLVAPVIDSGLVGGGSGPSLGV